MDKQAFIGIVGPIATKLYDRGSTIFPSVLIAQCLLETGGSIPSWNNLLGIKGYYGGSSPYWDGTVVSTLTREVIDGKNQTLRVGWRAYKSVEDCLSDHLLLMNKDWFSRVRAARTPEEQCQMLYACGYATDAPTSVDGDPSYDEKLIAIIQSYNLKKYDEDGGNKLMLDPVLNTMMADALTELSKMGQPNNGNEPILSYDWAEKAYKNELTKDEAIAITLIALARLHGAKVEVRS